MFWTLANFCFGNSIERDWYFPGPTNLVSAHAECLQICLFKAFLCRLSPASLFFQTMSLRRSLCPLILLDCSLLADILPMTLRHFSFPNYVFAKILVVHALDIPPTTLPSVNYPSSSSLRRSLWPTPPILIAEIRRPRTLHTGSKDRAHNLWTYNPQSLHES